MKTKTYSISLTEGDLRILLALIADRAETDSPHNVRYLEERQKDILDQVELQGFEPPQSFKELYFLNKREKTH